VAFLREIPLIKKLIHHIVRVDQEMIKLYAMSIVPQIFACKPSAAKILMNKLYLNNYKIQDRDEVIAMLQSAYGCLGFTCEDIGAYSNQIPQCQESITTLAGYQPATNVKDESLIDLDIWQIKILTRVKAFRAVQKLYNFGKNSVIDKSALVYDSIGSMATSDDRVIAGYWLWPFQKYHNSVFYAHQTIVYALGGYGRYARMTSQQRGEFIYKTIQYQVMYMYALSQFYKCFAKCLKGESAIEKYWDKGVAYVVGSLEETSAETMDGMLMFDLANKRCSQFGTCNEDGRAEILSEIMAAFDGGRDAAVAMNCENVRLSAARLAHVLMVPVLQSVLHYAIKIKNLDQQSGSKDLAEGEVYALSVLPLIAEYNWESQREIEVSMIMKDGKKPVERGPQAVADAIGVVASKFGVTCSHIGADAEELVDCCRSVSGGSSPSYSRLRLFIDMILLCVVHNTL